MIRYFKRSRTLAGYAALAAALGGVAYARHTTKERFVPPSLSVSGAQLSAGDTGLRQQLSLRAAHVTGGRLVQVLGDGSEVAYTLDPVLQQQMSAYFKSYEVPYAAAVLYRLDSGAALVMTGSSAADSRVRGETLCLSAWAPAASVFKLVTANALLEAGATAGATCYHGGLRGLEKEHLVDDRRRDNQCGTLSDAVARSINPIIAKLATRQLDPQRLQGWAERFGFNRPIPFELPVQQSRAKIPADELEFARSAAGFWHTEISVLHGAVIAGAAATGRVIWPHVVKQVTDPEGESRTPPRHKGRRIAEVEHASSVRAMMLRTTTEGSARQGFYSRRGRPFLGSLRVAGKTGTLARRRPYLSYSWFVGVAPAEKPEVAFAVLLGNPAKWRIKASTAARVMVGKYMERSRSSLVAGARTRAAR